MDNQFKVINESFCFTARQKAAKIEHYLNSLSAEGWAFVALEPVMFLGFDTGFYLVMKRSSLSTIQE